MSLSVGIVGLPNVGKSTLFNALASRRLAPTAAHPFTTIEPHEAVVPVPDPHLDQLAKLVSHEVMKPDVVPATVIFIDIAGLVRGAHTGEGLGNQFLAKIREVDAIVHVVRAFEDPNVPHPSTGSGQASTDQIREDVEVVNLELELGGITGKPTIYVVNISENQITQKIGESEGRIPICAKLEEELSDLTQEERKQYLKELGVQESGLEKLIREAYKILGLITFYTIKGGKEVRAWSIKQGSAALSAAEGVHTDFAQHFIKAEAIGVQELLAAGSWHNAKEKGWVRLEGRDYVVQDRDVIEFKVGS